MAQSRSIVYVDGFNLYKGAIEGGPNRWLDLQKYFLRLRQHDDVVAIKYFTALVYGDKRKRQLVYNKALETRPLVEIVLGIHKRKHLTCQAKCRQQFRTFEEKRTDVNIAVHLLRDAYEDRCDTFVVVSGDSDLVPPIEAIRARFPKKRVFVYVPARNPTRAHAQELRGAAHKEKTLPIAPMKHSLFDPVIRDGGAELHAPEGWISAPKA